MRADYFILPPECDERLHEWSAYFKDRHKYSKAGSAEGNYQPHSDDFAIEGWGEQSKSATQRRKKEGWILRAIETNAAIVQLEPVPKWSVTYFFCYPALPRFVVLRCLKKFTKRPLTWKQYLEAVDMGRLRVWAILNR